MSYEQECTGVSFLRNSFDTGDKKGRDTQDSHEERWRGKEWRMCNLSSEKRHGS